VSNSGFVRITHRRLTCLASVGLEVSVNISPEETKPFFACPDPEIVA
jgi:hypothetical protein